MILEEISKSELRQWLIEALWESYLDARKGKRKSEDEFKFESNDVENIINLADDILTRRYAPSRGIAFISYKPVMREIFAAPFRDRVVHHFLYNLSAKWWDERMIKESYSCREKKGTLYGIMMLHKQMNLARAEFGEPVYIYKCDLKGYFMSLPREGLFKVVSTGLRQQFPKRNGKYPQIFYIARFLWKQIIFDDPTQGVKRRGNLEAWKLLDEGKSLFCQPEGVGIVIGNLSSQLLSNIYLTRFDKFMKEHLGYKYYGRYVDDFYFLVPESKKKQASRDLEVIRHFLLGMGLRLHPKKLYIQNINRGVNFLGAKIYPNRILPGARIIKNYYRAVREVAYGHKDPDIVTSFSGTVGHYKSFMIQKKIFGSVGWDLDCF